MKHLSSQENHGTAQLPKLSRKDQRSFEEVRDVSKKNRRTEKSIKVTLFEPSLPTH